MLRSLENKIVFVGLFVVSLIAFSTYISVRLYVTYKTATDLAILQDQFRAQIQAQEGKERIMRDEINDIERTLYAAPAKPDVQRRPSTLELWQVNRDRELRGRIASLEQRLYRLEK